LQAAATLVSIRWWYWLILFLWLGLAAMGFAALHDYGFSTIRPLASGPLGILDAALSIAVLTLPVWTFFIAR
jgi:hypothetical protein